MKNLLLFLVFTGLFCSSVSAQTWKYHRFQTYSTVENACIENNQDRFQVKVNLNINRLLTVGDFYVIDFGSFEGLGVRYCKVSNRYNGRGDADLDLNGAGIGNSINVCIQNIRRYHRFDTFTTLEKAKNNVCGESSATDGRYKANIFIDRLLDVGKVYQINLGGSLGTRYCKILNRANGRGDADLGLNNLDGSGIGNPVSITCSVDSDGDGINDDVDQCPNQAGPSSNNGCPVPTGKPNVVVADVIIETKDDFGSSVTYNTNSTDVKLYYNKLAKFKVVIWNKGDGPTLSGCNVVLAFDDKPNSYPNAQPGQSPAYLVWNDDYPVLQANQKVTLTFEEPMFDNFFGIPLNDGKTYYYHTHVDYLSNSCLNEDEPATRDNINSSYKFKYIKKDPFILPFPIGPGFELNVSDSYNVSVYDIYGNRILEGKKARNKKEEDLIVESLPKGIYIIKTPQGDRKVSNR